MNIPAEDQMTPDLQALHCLMQKMDRSDPVGEAAFSALETAALLICVAEPHGAADPGRLKLLRNALGAARASVAAATYAVTSSADEERMQNRNP